MNPVHSMRGYMDPRAPVAVNRLVAALWWAFRPGELSLSFRYAFQELFEA